MLVCSDMSTSGLLFQRSTSIKIQLDLLVQYKANIIISWRCNLLSLISVLNNNHSHIIILWLSCAIFILFVSINKLQLRKLIYKMCSCHDIAEILLKLALNTKQSINQCVIFMILVEYKDLPVDTDSLVSCVY